MLAFFGMSCQVILKIPRKERNKRREEQADTPAGFPRQMVMYRQRAAERGTFSKIARYLVS